VLIQIQNHKTEIKAWNIKKKQNPHSKIGLSTFSPKSEMKTDNDFALVILGKLSVGTSKTFYVNGPLFV
jgi:hypothetical protein